MEAMEVDQRELKPAEQIAKLQHDLDSYGPYMIRLEAEYAHYKGLYTDGQSERQNLLGDAAKLNERIENLNRIIKKLEYEKELTLAEKEKDQMKSIESHNEAISSLNASLEEANQLTVSIQTKLTKSEKARGVLENEKLCLTARIYELQRSETMNPEIIVLSDSGDIEKLKKEKEELTKDNRKLVQDLLEARKKLSDAEKLRHEKGDFNGERLKLHRDLKEAHEIIFYLERKSKKKGRKSHKDKKTSEIENEIEKLNDESEKLLKEKTKVARDLEETRKKLEEEEGEHRLMKCAKAELESKIDILEGEVKILSEENAALINEKSATEKIRALESDKDPLRMSLEEMTRRIEVHEQEKETLLRRITQCESESVIHQTRCEKLENHLKSLEESSVRMREILSEKDALIEKLNDSNSKLLKLTRVQNEKLHVNVEHNESDPSTHARIEELEKEIEELKARLSDSDSMKEEIMELRRMKMSLSDEMEKMRAALSTLEQEKAHVEWEKQRLHFMVHNLLAR